MKSNGYCREYGTWGPWMKDGKYISEQEEKEMFERWRRALDKT